MSLGIGMRSWDDPPADDWDTPMFGFACPLCWDRHCNCSPEALANYYNKLEEEKTLKKKKKIK